MTKLNTDNSALVAEAGRKWQALKAGKAGLEARIRARVREEMDAQLHDLELGFATAARVAIDSGATKVSLRHVSSKNPGTLESFLAMLDTAAPAAAGQRTSMPSTIATDVALSIAWEGEYLRLTIDPETVRRTNYDRSNPSLWSGLYESYQRPDGRVFINPAKEAKQFANMIEHGVTEWLLADRAHQDAVGEWVKAGGR